jgi:thiol-disulfide isomerase/thioredoxin
VDGSDPTSGNTPEPTGAAAALGIDLDASGPQGSQGPRGDKPGSRSRGILIAGIVIGAVFLLWLAVSAGSKKGLDNAAPEGKPAPGFELDTINGNHVDFADLKGKPVFVNFWASWCGPCKDEGPVLADAYRRWKGSGIYFIGVDESDSASWARTFEEFYGIEYDSAFDPSGLQYQRWGLSGYPESFLVDSQGKIVAKKLGAFYTSKSIDEYLSLLAPGFTPEPPGPIVAPSGEPPLPQESPAGEIPPTSGPTP